MLRTRRTLQSERPCDGRSLGTTMGTTLPTRTKTITKIVLALILTKQRPIRIIIVIIIRKIRGYAEYVIAQRRKRCRLLYWDVPVKDRQRTRTRFVLRFYLFIFFDLASSGSREKCVFWFLSLFFFIFSKPISLLFIRACKYYVFKIIRLENAHTVKLTLHTNRNARLRGSYRQRTAKPKVQLPKRIGS